METSENFKNSPIHDKRAILKMMDELKPEQMIKVVDFIIYQVRNSNVFDIIKRFIDENGHLDKYDNDMGGHNDRFFDDLYLTTGLPKNEDNAKLVSRCIHEYYSG